MSSGEVVGTISTTICAPADCSKAASLASSAARWASFSVPVWSMTCAVSAGTGSTSCAQAGASAAHSQAASSKRSAHIGGPGFNGSGAHHLDAAGAAGAALSKLTLGGALIWASFCTVKLGLTP
jgi:hypothetical protein